MSERLEAQTSPLHDDPNERRVLLLAPTTRDGDASQTLFASHGIACERLSNLGALCDEFARGAGIVILPEEAVLNDVAGADRLAAILRRQPVWSDLPIIVLSRSGVESPAVARALATLGNVTLIERPVRVSTLLSLVQTALRARARQYDARDQIIAQHFVSERLREAAERLGVQSRLFDSIAAATPDFLYVFSLDGRFKYANRRLLEVFGIDSLGPDGKTMAELGYPKWHADMHIAEIAQVVETKQPIRGEVPFTGLSGISGLYEYIFTPVLGPDGEVEAVAGTTRDVTARKRGEMHDRFLVRLDDATRGLTDPSAVIRTSAQMLGEHLGANRCAYAEVEADEDTFDLTGDYCHDVPSCVGRYRFRDFGNDALQSMRSGATYVVDDAETDPRTVGVSSAYRAIQLRAVACVPLLKGGRFVAAMAVHQALARHWNDDEVALLKVVASRCWESIERARVARSLADNEQRLRLAIQTGKLGVWEVDLRTQQMNCSDLCKANFGRRPEESLTYHDLWASVHPADSDRVRDTLKDALSRRAEIELEYRTVWPNGEVHWILVRARVSFARSDVPIRMVGVSVDITERKSAEENRARLLEQEQAARSEAERASRMKDEFLATLSHELRTPLSAILGWSQILRRGENNSDVLAEGLSTIERNARAQTQIIEDLLDMSRIISGKVSLDARRIDLAEVIRAAIETVKSASTAKDIEVVITPEGDAPHDRLPVLGDPTRLQQVFWNLLSNAIKFTPRGGKVQVRVGREASQWRVSVIDNGEGISPEFLPHVFDRFRQADASTTRRHGGLGLGLAIVKQLVELHGGGIAVTSEGAGTGSTFSVTFPMSATHDGASASKGKTKSAAATSEPLAGAAVVESDRLAWDAELCQRMHGVTALIVDDEPDARVLLRRVLEECGMSVLVATTAAEALAMVERHRPDILVSDVGMPEMDGHALIQAVRDLGTQRGGATPAIALTAYARAEDRVKAIRAGFHMHVPKPVEPAELLTMVATLVGRAKS